MNMKQDEIVNEIRRMCGQTKRENNLQKIGYFVSILFINGKKQIRSCSRHRFRVLTEQAL